MSSGFAGPARRRAPRVLDDAIEQFRDLGYRAVSRRGPLAAWVEAEGRQALTLQLVPEGRVFGGTYGLEVSTARPVLPRTAGLAGRARGAARMRGVAFRARRGDRVGARLAKHLARDDLLAERLARVHFERIRVEPDGRPVIRHLGGSLVWLLFPPLVKSVPLVREQAEAIADALEAFAAAGAADAH